MSRSVHHVAVAVRDIDDALIFWRDALGLPVEKRAVLSERGVEVALLSLANSRIELVRPLDPAGSVARFIERRGEALHHICFTTDDIDAEMAQLRKRGVELIDDAPYQGIDGRVCFIHPRAHAGVLVELIEPVEISSPSATGLALSEIWALKYDKTVPIAAWSQNLGLEVSQYTSSVANIDVGGVHFRVADLRPPPAADSFDGLGLLALAADDLQPLNDRLQSRGVRFFFHEKEGEVNVISGPGHSLALSLRKAKRG